MSNLSPKSHLQSCSRYQSSHFQLPLFLQLGNVLNQMFHCCDNFLEGTEAIPEVRIHVSHNTNRHNPGICDVIRSLWSLVQRSGTAMEILSDT